MPLKQRRENTGNFFVHLDYKFLLCFKSQPHNTQKTPPGLDVTFVRMYEAYSESKYRFAVKKISKDSYKMLLLSDSTFFKLFFHIFAAIIKAHIVAGHKFLYTLLIECGRLRC